MIFIERLGQSLERCRAATLLVALVTSAVITSCGRSEISKIDLAIWTHDLSEIKKLVGDNPNLVFNKDESGDTLLHLAAKSNQEDVAEFLLANKAEVNAKDNMGLTPLHFAAIADQTTIAELLLAHGADVNAKDNRFTTPLDGARNKDVAELLLAKGADVNATSEGDMTPLDWAVFNRNKEVAEFLREHGGK